MSEHFWFKEPASLFREDTWTRFVPTQNMTTTEALNAVVRFSVYASVLLFVATKESSYMYAIPIVALASIVLFYLFPNGRRIESYLNSAGPTSKKYTMPTPDNPFMNVQLTEIGDNPDRPDAAPITDKSVREEIYKAFKKTRNIHMDTSDLFDQTQAMRTFHTMQSAKVPNDQDAFLAWLAKGYDEPDTSSAPLARGGKELSEGYTPARGSLAGLTNSTAKPQGTSPLSPSSSE